jgi:hypothetical protein
VSKLALTLQPAPTLFSLPPQRSACLWRAIILPLTRRKWSTRSMRAQCRVLNGTHGTRRPAPKARGVRPARSAQSSRCQPPGRAARLRSSRQSLNEHCMHHEFAIASPIRGYKWGTSATKRGSPCPPQDDERAWSSPRSSSSAGGSGRKRRRSRRPRPPATDRPGGTRRSAPPSREGSKAGTYAAHRLSCKATPRHGARGMEPRGAAVGRPPTIMYPDSKPLAARGRADESTHPLLSLLCSCFSSSSSSSSSLR